MPLDRWLRTCLKLVGSMLQEDKLASLGKDPTKIQQLWNEQLDVKANHGFYLWNLVMLGHSMTFGDETSENLWRGEYVYRYFLENMLLRSCEKR